MPLSAHEAFKVGFLARCVEDGLLPEQIEASAKVAADLMEKQAVIGPILSGAAEIGKGALGTVANYGLPTAIVAPPLLGGLLGYGLAKATDIDDRDVEDVKNREVIDEYNRQTEKLQRQKAVRDYLKSKQKTSRTFM